MTTPERVILRGETHKGLLWRLRSQEGGSMSRRIFLAAVLGIACAIASSCNSPPPADILLVTERRVVV